MISTTHVTIHHDPEGRVNPQLRRHIDNLRHLFFDNFVVVTQETIQNRETDQMLKEAGFRVTIRSSAKERQVDTALNIALIAGETRGKGDSIFVGCLDRTLHWLDTYPDELKGILANGTGDNGYIILGRTKRAFATHPLQQQEPEAYTNEVTARLLNMENVDVATGCRLLTRQTAKLITRSLSQRHMLLFNPDVDIDDSVWPLIAYLEGKKVGYIQTEGLEFETPDQYKEEISELGYDEWLRKNFTSANTTRRWDRAYITEQKIKRIKETYMSIFDKERGY